MAAKTKPKAKVKAVKKEKVPGMLPGMEEKRDPVLSKQCERLLEAQREKTEARGKYKDVHDKFIELLKARSLKAYKHDGRIFQIESPEVVKHKNLKKQEGNGVNPASDDDDGDEEPLDAVGVTSIAEGLQEIADEGPEGDAL